MKTYSSLITFLLAVNLMFGQIPLPYGSISENLIQNQFDTTGHVWYEYNSNNLVTTKIQQTWDNVLNKFIDSYRYDYVYDANERLIKRIDLNWNKFREEWDTTSRIINKYTNNLLITETFDQYSFGWNILRLDSNFYLGNGLIQFKKIYWQTSSTSYQYSGSYEYTYNANDSLSKFLYLWINANNVSWDTISRYETTYDLINKKKTTIRQNHSLINGWENASKHFYTHNSDNKLIQEEIQTWNTGLLDWTEDNKTLYTFHPDKSRHQELYQKWDIIEEAYNTKFKTTYLYGSPVGVQKEGIAIDIHLYPNPSNGFINISWKSYRSAVNLQIFDQGGKLMHQEFVSGESQELNLSALNPGMYFVLINDGKGSVMKSFIKK